MPAGSHQPALHLPRDCEHHSGAEDGGTAVGGGRWWDGPGGDYGRPLHPLTDPREARDPLTAPREAGGPTNGPTGGWGTH